LLDKEWDVRGGRPGLGAARAPAEGIAADGVLHGSERKAVPLAVRHNLLFRSTTARSPKNRAGLM
jgi:hypothetical protein